MKRNIIVGKLIKEGFSEKTLVKFNDKLYVIEPVDLVKCTYVRKAVEYHPLQHMI